MPTQLKAQTSLSAALHHLAICKHYFDDYTRDNSNNYAGRLSALYSRKLDWIAKDIVLHPLLTPEIRERIKNELKSDVFELLDIQQKIHLLSPEQRELIDKMIDAFLAGEEIVFTES